MKAHHLSLPFSLLLLAAVSHAITFPVKRVKSGTAQHLQERSGNAVFAPHVLAAGDSGVAINNVHDLIYLANITVGGNPYVVQLDTGSSDLWIKGPASPLPNAKPTTISYNISYGIGWAYGTVAYAPVEFAGIKIPSQAFLDVASVNNPVLSYDADGIAGLGFTSLSTVDALVNQTGASSGRSLLFNAFNDNPQEPNYIAFSLQRVLEPDDEVDGTFSIGETQDEYKAVMNTASIPTFPVTSPRRWSILLDGMVVGGKPVSVSSSVTGAPSNKAVVVLDTGTSYTYTSTEVCNAIYGGVPGARFDAASTRWIVPCDAEINMALQIGGVLYPLHPLDVTPNSLTDPSECIGSFVPQSVSVGRGEFDWLIGDNVLRSVYTVYDFGDFDSSGKMGNPYVKLLSIIDPHEASVDFHNIRGGAPDSNITYNSADNGFGGSTSTVNISDDLAKTLNKIGTFLPALLAIMALNALVILLLIVAAGVYMYRRRNREPEVRRRVGLGRALTPMPGIRPPSMASTSYDMPPVEPHVYQPVSMALTEDPLLPPSPKFMKGERPRSVA